MSKRSSSNHGRPIMQKVDGWLDLYAEKEKYASEDYKSRLIAIINSFRNQNVIYQKP